MSVPLNHFGVFDRRSCIDAEGILTIWCLTNIRELLIEILNVLRLRPLTAHIAQLDSRGIYNGLAGEGADNKVYFSLDAVSSEGADESVGIVTWE